jgi:hypothetical protein
VPHGQVWFWGVRHVQVKGQNPKLQAPNPNGLPIPNSQSQGVGLWSLELGI